MRVWIVETGLQGVNNQCLGIANAIASRVPCDIETVTKTIRTKRFRYLVNWALKRGLIGPSRNSIWSTALEKLLYKGDSRANAAPDIVITALARSEYTAALMGGRHGAFTIHIGKPLNFPGSMFDFLVLVNGDKADKVVTPHVSLPIYPTQTLRRDIESKAEQAAPGRKKRWAVFLGGDGAGYRYSPKDWDEIATGLAQLADRFDAKLFVTTSRRTGINAERRISASMPAAIVEHAVWYGTEPQAVIADYLARCEIVFCTADSRSMIADAVAAGRPVYAINKPNAATDVIHERFLALQQQAHRICTTDLSRLAEIDVDADRRHYFKPLERCWSEELLDALVETDFSRRFVTNSLPQQID